MSATSSASPPETYDRPFRILLGPLIAGFMGLYSEAALNIALPQLMIEFDVSAAVVQWLTTGYLLMVGILLPLFGILVRWFTTRQLAAAAMVLFTVGAVCSGLATSFEILLIGRFAQGLATGILIPLIFNTAIAVYPPNKRGTALGMTGLVIMFAPAISPVAAGLIVEYLTWNWIFWFMLPLIAIAAVVSIMFLRNVRPLTKPKVDVLSIVLSTLGFGGIVLGVSLGGESGWGSLPVIGSLLVGAAGVGLFAARQLRLEHPMLDVRSFGYRNFALGALVVLCTSAVLMGAIFLIPMFLQRALLIPVLIAGLLMLPGGAVNGVLSAVAGRLADRLSPKYLACAGLFVAIIATTLFITLDTSSAVIWVVLAHCALMIGIPLALTPTQTLALNSVPLQLSSDGSTILSTLQQIGGAIGTALGASLLSAGSLTVASETEGAAVGNSWGFMFALGASIIALVLVLFIKKQRRPVEA